MKSDFPDTPPASAPTPLTTTISQAARIFANSPYSVMITDASGIIEYVNDSLVQSTGYTADELIGQTPRVFKSGQQPAQVYDKLWLTIAKGGTWRGILCNRAKSGKLLWESTTIHPISAEDGSVSHFLAIKDDVSVHRNLEDQLRQLQKLEAVGVLAGGIAHDYNNMLTAMLAHLSLLQQNLPPAHDPHNSVSTLAHLVKRAATLTRQLLDFSRPSEGVAEPTDAGLLLEQAAKLLKQLVPDNITFVAHRPPRELWMMANAGMVEQVLMNLVINARDAITGDGRITLEVSALEVSQSPSLWRAEAYPGQFVCFRVTDTGAGIDPETRARLFEPFFSTKEGAGTGLGLATSLRLIQRQHGWIEVDSEPGRGSTFRVYLPATSSPAAVPDVAGARTIPGGSETILVVDDHREVRTALVTNFRSLGYTVFEASSGKQALEVYGNRNLRIAAVVTDYLMPGGVNGLDLIIELRKFHPKAVAIVCSGYGRDLPGSDATLERTVFLPKPLEVTSVGPVLRRLMNDVAR